MRDYGKKTVVGGQLVWWKAQADEQYWYTHFVHQIDSSHLAAQDSNSRVASLLEKYLPKEGRILEAGCGTGWLVSAFQRRGYNIEGGITQSHWFVRSLRDTLLCRFVLVMSVL